MGNAASRDGCCFSGVLAPAAKASPAKASLPVDLATLLSPPARNRRFQDVQENLSVEQVLASLQPRPAVTGARGCASVEQSWASPVPRPGTLSSMQDRDPRPGELVLSGLDQPATTASGTPQRSTAGDRSTSVARLSRFQVEQLVASPGPLPQPLPAHEREQVIRQLIPTATHETLSKLPRHLVEARTLEGQTLRRRLVRGSTVVFFSAGYAGKRFVFERAAQLGVKAVVIEHPDSWARGLVAEGLISKFLPVDMGQSSDKILEQSLELIKDLGKDGITGEADGIVTFVELSLSIVGRLCERLGLPGPLPASIDKARDKHATRAALKDAGLPAPKNQMIHSRGDVAAAGNHVGFPAVLKPVSGAASLGVTKVMCAEDLPGAYERVCAELQSLVVVSGALQQGDGTGNGVAAEKAIDTSVLMEQYLDGHEVDVDVVMSDGEWQYVGITDNGPTVEPWFNETWGVCPSLLPLDQQRELKELGVACVKALGFQCGVFHVECKYTSHGPHLIEVNARMGGGPVHEHNLRTWGVDLVEEAIFIALGIPARPATPESPIEPVAYYLVPATRSGTVAALPDLAALRRERADVVWAKQMVKVGDKVVGPADGLPTWHTDIMVTAPSARAALDLVFEMEAKHQVTVR